QKSHRILDHPFSVERGFEEVVVESHAKRLQVEVLFLSQFAHRKLAERKSLAIRVVSLGKLLDVLAVIAALRNLSWLAAQLVESRLDARRKIIYLHTGVIVVELATDLPSRELEQRGDGIAKRRLP